MPRAYPLPGCRPPGLLRMWLCAALVTSVAVPAVVTAQDQPSELPDAARTYRTVGQEAYEDGRYKEALDAFQRALETDPRQLEAALGSAALLLDMDRRDEAIRVLSERRRRHASAPTQM